MMKAEERRSELREALLLAAERRISADGLAAMKARQLAVEVGCAVGQIYNLYDDLDSLILAVNARTLDELDARLASVAAAAPATAAEAALAAQAEAYLAFADENRNRWQAIFQHRMAGGGDLPAWYVEQQARLFSHIDGPLRTLLPDLPPAKRALLGRSIFSAVHGIVWLGVAEKLGRQSRDELSGQLAIVARALIRGLGS